VHAVQLAEAAAGVRSAPVSPLGSPPGSPAGRGRGRGRGRRAGGRSRGESPRDGAEAVARGDEARSVPAPEAGLGSEVGVRARAAASAAPPARIPMRAAAAAARSPATATPMASRRRRCSPRCEPRHLPTSLCQAPCLKTQSNPADECRGHTMRRCWCHATLLDACMLSLISIDTTLP
jgi:hypothetical protein